MRRQDLEVGLEVRLHRPRSFEERAIIIDLSPGWSSKGPRRPWTAFTDPAEGGWMRPKHVDGQKVDGAMVRWGDTFTISPKRNQNIAVAIEVRRRPAEGLEPVHSHWEPDVIPLSQIIEPWASHEVRLAEQVEQDRLRNAALYARRDERMAKWERDLLPVLRRVFPDTHTFIDGLGMDYVDMRPSHESFHQFRASHLEELLDHITVLETQLDEARKALAP